MNISDEKETTELVGEKNVEGVHSFTYLGALINSRNDMDQSIR
jgi:hypothetical protein